MPKDSVPFSNLTAWTMLILCLPFALYGIDIEDTRVLKQDHMFYVDQMTCRQELVRHEEQIVMDCFYNEKYFSLWRRDAPAYGVEDILGEFEKYTRKLGYDKNGRALERVLIDKIRRNAGLQQYPNTKANGITVNVSNLRILPTNLKRFASAGRDSQFDSFQVSSIGVNVPVYISHATRDKAWYLVETDYYFGWLPARDVAFVDDPARNAWENGRYIAVVKDKSPALDQEGRLIFYVSLGAIFPLTEELPDRYRILIAVGNRYKMARFKTAFIPRDNAVLKPMKLTAFNIAALANELINAPYGWGGVQGKRDCSLMMRDLFAPFGIWLHRNSNEQGLGGGVHVDLAGFSDEDKRKVIIAEGIPYATLLWKKGHIMLYIGKLDGEPLIFHNLWSVRELDFMGNYERKILGRAAITTLLPGKNILSRKPSQERLLKDISLMTLLVPRQKP